MARLSPPNLAKVLDVRRRFSIFYANSERFEDPGEFIEERKQAQQNGDFPPGTLYKRAFDHLRNLEFDLMNL